MFIDTGIETKYVIRYYNSLFLYIYCFLMFDGFSNSLITFFGQNVTIFASFLANFSTCFSSVLDVSC